MKDFMKDVFGGKDFSEAFKFPETPLPPPPNATIGELIQNMEHNIKVRDK